MKKDPPSRNTALKRGTTPSPLSFMWNEEEDPLKDDVNKFMDGIQGSFDESETEPDFMRDPPRIHDMPSKSAINDRGFTYNSKKSIERAERKRAKIDDINSTWAPSRRQKKPKGMPKRPLSAYNLFFQSQRVNILEEQKTDAGNKKVGFKELGQIVGRKWRALSVADRSTYAKLAENDKRRYRHEIEAYYAKKKTRKLEGTRNLLETSTSADSYPSHRNHTMEDQFRPKHIGSYTFQSQKFNRPSKLWNAELDNHSVSKKDDRTRIPSLVDSSPIIHRNAITSYTSSELPQEHGIPSPYIEKESVIQTPLDVASLSPSNHRHMQISPQTLMSHAGQLLPPPGMEVILNEDGINRKYRVEYKCYSMSQESAQKYVDSLVQRPFS